MNFIEALKSCITNYVVFSGRASRSEFWWFYLFTVAINVVAGSLSSPAVSLLPLLVLLPQLAVGWRRMHDIGRSGWWTLAPFYDLYLWAQPSEIGENDFGSQAA